MKRKVKRFLLLVGIVSISFVVGYATATISHWPKPNRPCVERHANNTLPETLQEVDKLLKDS